MKRQIFSATSAALLMVGALSGQTTAVTQSKSDANELKLQGVTGVKQVASVNRDTGNVFTPEKNVVGQQKYIIRFTEEPLATYSGGIPGLPATAASTHRAAGKGSAAKLNAQSAASQNYLAYLDNRHATMELAMETTLGRKLAVKRRYRAALNGMAVTMTQEEAQRIASLPGIARIERDTEGFINTDRGPEYIGAPAIWDGSATGMMAKGEGITLGIMDSGIHGDHPSFAATGGDGYTHINPLGSGNFLGECDPASPDFNPAVECNDKLIGRYLFIDSTPTETDSEDTNGHGSHVASTAGGNFLSVPFLDAEGNPTGLNLDISGVAPHANIVAFQVCAPSCFTSDRVAAVEQAIMDGVVDVINHSIGSNTPVTIDPWTSSMDLAWLSARAAGITIANSAGNNGPGPSTLGGAAPPWITNSGAFTHDRAIETKFLSDMTGGDTAAPGDVEGRSVSAAYGPANIVYAGDYSNGDPDPEQCLTPFPAGTWTNGEIVVCDRGAIARVQKCINVRDGGAAGCVLANVDGGAESLADDAHVIPAIHIDAASGNAVKDWLATGTGHMATITDGLQPWTTDPAVGSIAAEFTSRGPHLGMDYSAIDVGSPGVSIYAAMADGVEYSFLSGTSMASPHTAGASALLKQARPDWTDAEILSALASTASTDAKKEDGVTPADPFDVGGGMIRVDLAAQAGLLLDETIANFEAADPNIGGDPKTLNVTGMVNRSCLINCSWVRTVEATADGSWTVSTTDPSISVSPTSFSLLAGETQSVVVSVDGSGLPAGEWMHGRVDFTPDGAMPMQHLTVSFVPTSGSVPSSVDITASRDADSYLVKDIESVEITDMQVSVGGLTAGMKDELSLAADSDNSTPYDDLSDGVFFKIMTASANASRLVAMTTDAMSEAPDVDVRVGFDANSNGMPDPEEEICASLTATATETCDVTDLMAGDWWVMVQVWSGSGTPPDAITLTTALVDGDNGNMTVDAPASVPAVTPFDIRLNYDISGAMMGDMYFGTVTLGSDAANPDSIGTIPVTITRGADDVNYMVDSNMAMVGDTLTFSVEVAPNTTNEDRNYDLNATIPAGFTLVPGSVTGGGSSDGSTVMWSISQPSLMGAQPEYNVVTSMDDPACAMPFANSGAYTDLEAFGIPPAAGVEGDTFVFSAFSGQNFNFYGNTFTGGFNFTDDGFAFFNSSPGTQPWVNLPIPDMAEPNDLLAGLWKDFIVPPVNTTPGSIVGVSLASAGADFTLIEYDNIEMWPGGGGDSMDMQMGIMGFADDTPGVYEIIFAYDNIVGGDSVGTIGVEDATGANGTQYAFNDVAVTNGMAVCFDLVQPSFDPVVVSYQVTVDASAAGMDVTSDLTSTLDTVGTMPVTVSQTVMVEGDPMPDYTVDFFGPLTRPGPKPTDTKIVFLAKLMDGGVQTNAPDMTFNLLDSNGNDIRSFDARKSPRQGGTYVRRIGNFLDPGLYTVEAEVEGEVVGSFSFRLSHAN